MSRNRDYKPEKNPLFVVLYILAVILLVCALVFMVYTGRERRKKQQEAMQKIASEETEYIIPERESETESESETEKKTTAKTSGKSTASKTAASGKKGSGTGTEEESEQESETETEVDKDISILVLNGTRKPGVAAYWKNELVKDGYTDVYTASYTEEAEEHTVLYSEDMAAEAVFEEYFPDCESRRGTVKEGIETEGDTKLPEQIDIYIIVGKSDSKNE